MTEQQIELVQNSWDYILLNTEEAGKLFYDRLFEIDPELRGLFSRNIDEQAEKLVSMISYAVSQLGNIESIVDEVKDLGKRHHQYRVEDHHYDTVAEALLWTLEQGMGDEWNEETLNAWVQVYTLLANTMKAA